MSQFNEAYVHPFTSGAAIGKNLRVKLSAGKYVLAGVGVTDETVEIGTTEVESFAADEVNGIRLRNAPGSVMMVADGAIAQGAVFYGAAAGKISATVSGAIEGITKQAAAANNDVIEVIRN